MIGLVGAGDLGGAIVRGWLRAGAVASADLLICTRNGTWSGQPDHPELSVTTDVSELGARCETVLLALPPAAMATFRANLEDCRVLSVMAGIGIGTLVRATGSNRVLRAMSNPAAARGMAYSAICPAAGALETDLAEARRLFAALGPCDTVETEALLDVFTAVTGPVPGFVALFADAMASYATARGVPDDVAQRAIRQLFLAGGTLLGEADAPPRDAVRAMLDYAGTTAAGIEAMQSAGLARVVAEGLDAARARAVRMGQDAEGGIE